MLFFAVQHYLNISSRSTIVNEIGGSLSIVERFLIDSAGKHSPFDTFLVLSIFFCSSNV